MKKVKVILLLFITLLLTGCVKYNANMNIKKDKSMTFNIIYAVDTSILKDEELLSESNKENLRLNGFTYSKYSKGNYSGYKIKMNIKNIDLISSTDNIEYDLSKILTDDIENDYMFKVKKGLIKNKYTANFILDTTKSDIESEDTKKEVESEVEDIDISSISNLDLSFNVNLPFPAIKTNATHINNNTKSLGWNLLTTESNKMTFVFELYNYTNLYILLGSIVLFVIIIVIIIIVIVKKNKEEIKLPDGLRKVSHRFFQAEPIQQEKNISNKEQETLEPDMTINSTNTVTNDIMSNHPTHDLISIQTASTDKQEDTLFDDELPVQQLIGPVNQPKIEVPQPLEIQTPVQIETQIPNQVSVQEQVQTQASIQEQMQVPIQEPVPVQQQEEPVIIGVEEGKQVESQVNSQVNPQVQQPLPVIQNVITPQTLEVTTNDINNSVQNQTPNNNQNINSHL